MPKQEGQRPKLLALLRIFETQTDENHLLNVPQLVGLLSHQGIPCERKSIYTDIDTLRRLGYAVELRRGRGGGYWLAGRAFDLAELKLLVDAVQASRVISEKKSAALIHKLEGLASRYEASQLQRQVYVAGRPKTENQHLLYSIDALHEAIQTAKQVSFVYRNTRRRASPWQLAWDGGAYYLIAYQDEKPPIGVRHYRVDRMTEVRVLEQPRAGEEQFAGFDLPAYLNKHFNMFGGPECRVTLRCASGLKDVMRERFGRGPVFLDEDDRAHFHFDVPVCVSAQFFGWVCGFGGKVEITAPDAVRARLHEMTQALADAHR